MTDKPENPPIDAEFTPLEDAPATPPKPASAKAPAKAPAKKPRQHGPRRVELTAKQKKAINIAMTTGSKTALIKEFRNNKATHNRNITARIKEASLTLVSLGYTVTEAATELGVSAALIRAQQIDEKEFGERMRQAREIAAEHDFDQMLVVAQMHNVPLGDRRLLIEVLEKRAKANNRLRFGDKVQVDQRQVIINLASDIDDVL